MLREDQGKPVTLAEALTNSAVRNAVLENVQLAVALNPSSREKLGVHLIGMVLSVCAGAANAIAFATFKYYVSHVSGSSTAIGLRMEGLQQPGDVLIVVELVFYFIVGSVIAGLIIPSATMKMGQARYELVLFLVAGMELVCWMHNLRYPEMLAAAMGLQNALISSWSGNVLRTTHMTGTATDMGSSLGRLCARYFRKGFNYTDEDWDQHTVDRQKFVLMTCLLVSFIAGGDIGARGYRSFGVHSLFIPAGLTTILGVGHMLFCMMHKEEMALEKKAEEIFARQLSGEDAGEDAYDDAAAEQFIRQISGGGAKADRVEQFVRQISGKPTPTNGAGVGIGA